MNKEKVALEVLIENNFIKRNKNIFLGIFLFFVLLFVVFYASKIFMDKKYVSEEEIKEYVFIHSVSTPDDVTDYKCKRTFSEKKLLYEISYADSKGIYKFIIDCETGEILEYTNLKIGTNVPETTQP